MQVRYGNETNLDGSLRIFRMFQDYHVVNCFHVAVAPTGYLSMKHLQPFPARILCQPGERGGMAGSVGGEASRRQNGKKMGHLR